MPECTARRLSAGAPASRVMCATAPTAQRHATILPVWDPHPEGARPSAINPFRASHVARGQMKSLLDPSFQYTTSFNTDLRKTFARVLRDRQKGVERTVPGD